jgi:hypothetical protein
MVVSSRAALKAASPNVCLYGRSPRNWKLIRLYTFESKARFSDQAIPPDSIVL